MKNATLQRNFRAEIKGTLPGEWFDRWPESITEAQRLFIQITSVEITPEQIRALPDAGFTSASALCWAWWMIAKNPCWPLLALEDPGLTLFVAKEYVGSVIWAIESVYSRRWNEHKQEEYIHLFLGALAASPYGKIPVLAFLCGHEVLRPEESDQTLASVLATLDLPSVLPLLLPEYSFAGTYT